MNLVYFVGAGPGDPELITVKGQRLLREAELIIYAGSLVNPALLDGLRARIYNSADLTLEEIIDLMAEAHTQGKRIVRLHTGDPAIYGAIKEQMVQLKARGIPFKVVPGVSAAAGCAAALEAELTLPEVSQSVIITRREGRTPVPKGESIPKLASHGTTMLIFLSVGMIDKVAVELREGGYPEDTPVAVVEKATWPEERVIRGTLADISAKVKASGIRKTAIIAVGRVFSETDPLIYSKLYDKDFSHGCRASQKG